jgi:hypothetical protein
MPFFAIKVLIISAHQNIILTEAFFLAGWEKKGNGEM